MYSQGFGRIENMLLGQPNLATEGGGSPEPSAAATFDSSMITFDATDHTFDEDTGG